MNLPPNNPTGPRTWAIEYDVFLSPGSVYDPASLTVAVVGSRIHS